MAIPPTEFEVDESLVRRLLRSQCPDLADLPLTFGASGWDNHMVRIGAHHVARLPRRAVGDALVLHEQRWLPSLAPLLPLPVPTPIVCGVPEHGYPWHWSVSPWLAGDVASVAPPEPDDAVDALVAFLSALHRPAPADAPRNEFRGVALVTRVEAFDSRLPRLGDDGLAERLRGWFAEVVQVPEWRAEPVWLHGDLHPANLLSDGGRLSGVVDWGDLCGGDPASDLAVAWMLWDSSHRARFFDALDTDTATRQRARGWAAALALAFLGDDGGPMTPIGRHTLAAVLDDLG